ncbi:ty1-copia retrotransposon protein [Cucumis melo var. makuwa]|uniref:Ty1-copia retrotransposon protein n=1 Tax=Cucumis melo var. makuwa TaxID=1194695 RepID=A0A5A7THG3_CUCMM|nr:ty1-copia retrotransposon protein [Cucumis melo var. makuwa]
MTDDKPVVKQIHEYENLVANVLFEGMKMCEILQANVLLEKFPPSWNDYQLLHDYEDTVDGECVFMRKSTTTEVIEKGKVILKLTSGKTLSLSNVLYVLSLRRNLVSGSLLNRAGLKIMLEGDKVVLTKNGEFVGKGYLSNGLFVLNTISVNANASSSAYVIGYVNLWHGRLGHVNFASIRKLKNLRLINTSESHETDEDPKTYHEALNSVESSMWKKAIKSELDSLVMNQTWDLVDLPMRNKPIRLRTPFDASKHLKKNKGDSASQPEYAKIIGSVMYLMNYTKPDIAYACDSQAAICTAKNSVYNGKSRHIRLRHAVVKQLLKEGTIFLEFVRSEKNLADPLTKGLTRKVVLDSSVNMGLKPFGDP